MGKIAPVSTKYIVHASINSEGVVEKPDVIGAIFGQTEGLLGNELELRELQKSGRIGRIDVELSRKKGNVEGEITIPSSLNKAETALIAAAVETIERVGPCDAKIKAISIEDVRVVKRQQVVKRARELLQSMMKESLSDSKEISDEVFLSVRASEIIEYGADKLAAGPGVTECDEVIVVEGRADVVNLLRCGFRNVISMNGTSVPKTIVDLSKEKEITLFVDGDRGGDLIVTEMKQIAEVDFIAVAPEGKEVEELTQKEIHKSLRAKVPLDQYKSHNGKNGKTTYHVERPETPEKVERPERTDRHERSDRYENRQYQKKVVVGNDKKKVFKGLLDDLTGTNGAYVLDEGLQILGKVPISELKSSLGELEAAFAVVLDGEVDKSLVESSKSTKLKYIVGMSSKIKGQRGIIVLTPEEL